MTLSTPVQTDNSQRPRGLRAAMLYEHCSPHQVAALEAARAQFAQAGDVLVPLECYSASLGYGWSFADRPRPKGWVCLFPGQTQVPSQAIVQGVRTVLREHQIDVLVLNGWYGRYAWPLILGRRKPPYGVVMVSDSNWWDRPRHWWKEWIKRRLLRQVQAGFVAGTPQRDYLAGLGMPRERMTLGNDVVDNALYEEIPARAVPSDRPVIVGTAARMIWEKNLLQAAEAFVEFQRQHRDPAVIWRIAGQGPLEKPLRDFVARHGASVEFLGFVGYHDMPRFYAGLDLYWQPSRYEHWGLVVNEAMASGLPILVSRRCGCATDLVDGENGWSHGVESGAEIAGALQMAVNDRHTWPEKGAASRRRIGDWGLPRFAEGLWQACRIARRKS